MKPGQSLKCWSIEYDSSGKIISFSCQRDKGCDGENPEIACGGKKCREGKCPQLSYRQQSLLAGKSKEEMIRVLCPKASETGLTGWSIRLDENKKPVSWKCQGECDNKPRNISCGEKDCPEPKCPELTQEQRAMLAGLSPEHIGRVLCPGVPGNNFAPRINQ